MINTHQVTPRLYEFFGKQLKGTPYGLVSLEIVFDQFQYNINKRILGLPWGVTVAKIAGTKIQIYDKSATDLIRSLAEDYSSQYGITVTIVEPAVTTI